MAGCPEIVVCTPCGKDGRINPDLLYAVQAAGATEVYRVGGAQAIAALALGTETIRRVQKERTAEQLKTFLHKIRVYTITDQDKPWGATVAFSISSHQWMRREFEKDLMFIWDECAWLHQNSTAA